jgi:hypothetical protein
MTEEVVPAALPNPVLASPAAVPFITPSPMGMPAQPAKPEKDIPDPDRFLMMAKQVAVANYNKSRDAGRSPELTMDSVYIVWFTKTLGNWKAIIASPTIKGLIWEIVYNAHRKECYVEVYKKLNSVKVSMEQE